MAVLNLIQNSSRTLRLEVPGLQSGLTITSATLVIKGKLSDLDADALITKTITAVASASGQILNSGSSGTASLMFEILEGDADEMSSLVTYIYCVQTTLSSGKKYSPRDASGIVRVRGAGVGVVA